MSLTGRPYNKLGRRSGGLAVSISILVEPAAGGFRAATGAPLNLSAEAVSVEAAVAAVRAKIDERLRAGFLLVDHPVPFASTVPVIPLHENPLFDDWLAAVEEYRRTRDVEERAAEAD